MDTPKKKRKKSYYSYEGLKFDSAWELCYYVCLKYGGVDFEYKPGSLAYRDGDKTRRYFPDFKVGDAYVEIKGNHLVLPDGTLCDLTKRPLVAKTEFFREIGVHVMVWKDVKPYIRAVEEMYGEGYVEGFKKTSGT